MEITFDPAKDAANIAKHGVPLSLATELDWESLWAKPDERRNYGEPRMIGYAIAGERLFCVVYTDRGEVRRVISLRKANPREVKRYVSED
ncbi:BrnT family toxin [Aromatoleum anaerobium]|uniref:BrnT family toxin n=1 Tax=Aromatoleum anaerobium TaxID=182180 RepID=A0ABX1PSA1_9RHOO|nr:BrnT family toxin [Aromatoleum anaerobium]MCK0506598.1 BrnT family toxin [Aromatoleum anaerobium]